ncbi:FAD/NAD(P)-binding protein [Hymenobacter jejuensis]|uniref:FAD-dependent urate hydroxylase HpyO/Asp monooxygenase CreE-like FAD/NAD(P)-binding domain-containing protein n=1 Tax=Hymenobacter jejuensis TaxID=2502781 RepID=A0A5B8A1H6_9BACT|nr:FAD/NAD(P)-binding protein [Hymenobacter jejuensis]QDA61234.1 hypothetical protein FHG12_14505 [Hymenobacter jejuensis]
MLAMQLAQLPGGPYDWNVHLVEPRPLLGPGLAYTARRPEYLLNVQSEFLSPFPDQPNHFVEWLQENHMAVCEDHFCPRQLYGRYLQEMVSAILPKPAANGMQFSWHPQAGVLAKVAPDGQSAQVRFSSGRELRSDMVVLALGNFPPIAPTGHSDQHLVHPRYHGNPWAPGALRDIGPQDSVLLIGSGLTAVDILLGLRDDGHRAPIKVVSRHKRWPAAHVRADVSYPSFYEEELAGLTTVVEVLRVVRKHVREAAEQGIDWRPVLDSLRPDTGKIWAAWPLQEQKRFLRHLVSLWTVLRHRSPPQNATIVREMVGKGSVVMQAGRVKQIEERGDDLAVLVEKGQTQEWLLARHVISCTGPLLDYSIIADPLVKSMREEGYLVPDPLHLGILTDENGALLNTEGEVSELFFTLGPSRRPAYFESTSVPELREQAVALAQHLGQKMAIEHAH